MSSAPHFHKLSILVAAYNEEDTLEECLEAVRAAPLPGGLEREIVVVDDGSRDNTWEIAQGNWRQSIPTCVFFGNRGTWEKGRPFDGRSWR